MANPPSRGQLASRLRAVRAAQRQVAKKIREVQEQVKRAEGHPTAQPWLTFKRAERVTDLQSRFPTLRKALEHDLKLLRAEMAALGRQAKALERAAERGAARRASKDLREALDEALKQGEREGRLDDGELGALRGESERVVGMFVDILDADPSTGGMDAVLGELEVAVVLGGDTTTGACGKAFRSLGRAATTLSERAEQRFRAEPSLAHFDKMIDAQSVAIKLGGAVKHEPPGWKAAKPGTFHVVAPGDTLSAISQQYYGSPGYWDMIYRHNLKIIGNSLEKLEPGLRLAIP